MSPRSSTRRPIRPRKKAPERTKPARGRDGNRRSRRQSPVVNQGEPARAIFGGVRHVGIARKGDFLSGEGGIRTLEAGISPPNALAGRRLQPLGHFSGRAHRTAAPCTRKPARARAFGERRERDLNPRCTFQHIRDFQSRSLDRSDTPPSGAGKQTPQCDAGRPGPSASVAAKAICEHGGESTLKDWGDICRQSSKFDFEKGLEQT